MAQRIEIHILQDDDNGDYAYIQPFGDGDLWEDNAVGRIFARMMNAVADGADDMTLLDEGH